MTRNADVVLRYMLLFLFLAGAIAGLVLLAGCAGAYKLEHPLGPTKSDRLPICDHAALPKTCERT